MPVIEQPPERPALNRWTGWLNGLIQVWRQGDAQDRASTWFTDPLLHPAYAIDNDNGESVVTACRDVRVNAPGRQGITLLMYALIRRKKFAAAQLLKLGADPNQRAENKQNAVTLAARLAPEDLDYLQMVLDHHGDPNTREPNDDPILIRMIAESAIKAIRLLKEKGADLNVRDRNDSPAVLLAGSIEHWEPAWTLLELGADWAQTQGGRSLAWAAHTSVAKEGSNAYPFLQKTIEYLKAKRAFPPLSPGQELER